MAMATTGGESCLEWVLSPFVDPSIRLKKDRFLKELAVARKLSVGGLKAWLRNAENIADLMLTGLSDLAAAYAVVASDFNLTSLCLYSGPKTNVDGIEAVHHARLGSYFLGRGLHRKIGWLATGDAALNARIRAKAFIDHYGQYLGSVGTLVVPHHGSDYNHNEELIARINAEIYVVAADNYSKWRHPGSKITKCVASMGRFLSVVTSNSQSEVKETIFIGCSARE
jgi:hypothetical protein